MDADALLAQLLDGQTPALARAISVVENGRKGFETLLAGVHRHLGRARRIGITGPPGAGKSTLTERLVTSWRARSLSVAVIAVDPTSPFTGGALLGDRIRMESVALDPNVFIRSMASRGSLGGLATTTREVCDLLDAAGFDRILVETVGVGQSELDVARMADTTLLVLVPESGDGIQALKSGVMEAADVIVVNKADRPGADRMRKEVETALQIRRGNAGVRVTAHHGALMKVASLPPGADERGWQPKVIAASATKGDGIGELADALDTHFAWLEASDELSVRRRRRVLERTREVVDRALGRWLWQESEAEARIAERMDDVVAGRMSPYEVAAELVDGFRQGVRL